MLTLKFVLCIHESVVLVYFPVIVINSRDKRNQEEKRFIWLTFPGDNPSFQGQHYKLFLYKFINIPFFFYKNFCSHIIIYIYDDLPKQYISISRCLPSNICWEIAEKVNTCFGLYIICIEFIKESHATYYSSFTLRTNTK